MRVICGWCSARERYGDAWGPLDAVCCVLSAVAVWWLLRRPRPRDNRRLSGREAYARMIARSKRGRR
jgi:hypothetical protein